MPVEEKLVVAEPLPQGVIGSRHGEIQTASPNTGGWKPICPTKEDVCAGRKVCMPRCKCLKDDLLPGAAGCAYISSDLSRRQSPSLLIVERGDP